MTTSMDAFVRLSLAFHDVGIACRYGLGGVS